MPRYHQSLTGHRIEYPDLEAPVEKFVCRVQAQLEDDTATEDDMIALIYGSENPILDHTLFPERGAVTREVLDNPVYHVLTDLLARKRFKERSYDTEKLAARYTLTVRDAAQQLGIAEGAVRQAIAARRIPSWIKGNRHYIDPKALETLEVGTRGPIPAYVTPLKYRVGYDWGSQATMQLKTVKGVIGVQPKKHGVSTFQVGFVGDDDKSTEANGDIERWRRVGVLIGSGGSLRFFVIEPSASAADPELRLGIFFVLGNYQVVEKINNAKLAREAWDKFRAA